MTLQRWRRALAVVAVAVTITAAPVARGEEETVPPEAGPAALGIGPAGGLVVLDYLKDATPEEADEGLRQWCEFVPGCVAIWLEGVGTTVILQRVPAEGSGSDPSDAIGDY